MKKLVKYITIIFLMVMVITLVPASNTQAATKKTKNKVTYTLKDGVLTIKGKGKMPKSMKFKKNKKIKKVVIKKGVTSIPTKAFYKCKNLKEVKIANTVKEIGAFSFSEIKIKKITILKSVKVIGDEALSCCSKLTEVTMPGDFKLKSVLSGSTSNIMYGCSKLKTVNFNTDFNVNIANRFGGKEWNVRKKDSKYKSIDGVIYTKDGKKIVCVPEDIEVLNVSDGCETFCFDSIFYLTDFYESSDLVAHCYGLKKFILPKSIKYIELSEYPDDAIEISLQDVIVNSENLDAHNIQNLVSSLKQVYVYGTFKDIYPFGSMDVFAEMFKDRIEKDGNFYILDKNVLLGYEGNENTVKVPEGIKVVGDKAFAQKKCEKVILPETVEEIGERAFYNCKNLKEINFTNVLTTIGTEAFYGAGFEKIQIPENIVNWGKYVFASSDLKEVILPENMNVIPEGMFNYCRNLTKVNVPKNLTTIEESAFALTKVEIDTFLKNQNLTTIETWAFLGVEWTELCIPKHVKTIGGCAFDSFAEGKKRVTIEGDTSNYAQNAFTSFYYYGANTDVILTFKGAVNNYFTDVTIDSVKESKKGKYKKVKFNWAKIEEVDGYDIVLSSNKKFKKNIKKTTAKKNEARKTVKVSKKWKKVHIKIRPYKVVKGQKVYGKWASWYELSY